MSAPEMKASPLLIARSLVFAAWLYGMLAVMGVGGLPVLLGPRWWSMRWMRWWAQTVVWGMKVFLGIGFEVRGLEHRPPAGALVACKHQCMFDTVAPFIFFDDTCFVLKKELTILPVYGWFAARARMIAVDRSAHSKALRALVHASRDRLAEGRQVIIFPEGTRKAPGSEPDYKPGVAALYRELEAPCTPMATNSGVCWPPHGLIRRPGTIVFEFLPPIPPGMKRASFMAVLEDTIEAASNRLIAEQA